MSNNQNQGASIEAERIVFHDFRGMLTNCICAATVEKRKEFSDALLAAIQYEIDAARRSVPPAAGETEDLPLPSDSSEHEQFVAWVDSMQEPARAHLTAWNGWEARARLDSNQSATTDLPPLPRNYGRFNINGPDENRIRGWTQEQMQQYAREAIAADRAQRKQATPPATGAIEYPEDAAWQGLPPIGERESIMDVCGLPRRMAEVLNSKGSATALKQLYELINKWGDARFETGRSQVPATGATEDLPAGFVPAGDQLRIHDFAGLLTNCLITSGERRNEASTKLLTAIKHEVEDAKREAIAHYLRKQAGQVGAPVAYACPSGLERLERVRNGYADSALLVVHAKEGGDYTAPLYLAAPASAQPAEHCPHCDDTGDVHTPTGEWRGACSCPAGAQPDQRESAAETCQTCNGSGWVVRDPDIGTDQECFVCNGTGRDSANNSTKGEKNAN